MPLDLASHHFLVYVSLGSNWRKIENLPLKPDYEAVLDFKCQTHLFYQLWSLKPPYNDLPNHVAQLVPLGKLLDVK